MNNPVYVTKVEIPDRPQLSNLLAELIADAIGKSKEETQKIFNIKTTWQEK